MQNESNLHDLFFAEPEGSTAKQNPAKQSFKSKEAFSPKSLVQRFRESDPVFKDKFSSGATPPQKRLSKASSNIYPVIEEEAMMKKSKSHYYKRSTNQTMKNIYAKNNQFFGTMSPNELQVLNSDISGVSGVEDNDNNQQNQLSNTMH